MVSIRRLLRAPAFIALCAALVSCAAKKAEGNLVTASVAPPPSMRSDAAPGVPQPQFGSLHVVSSPSGATILLDGESRGVTPLDVSTTVGIHQLDATLDGFTKQSFQVVFAPGPASILSIGLAAAPALGSTSPDAATLQRQAATRAPADRHQIEQEQDASWRRQDQQDKCNACRVDYRRCMDAFNDLAACRTSFEGCAMNASGLRGTSDCPF